MKTLRTLFVSLACACLLAGCTFGGLTTPPPSTPAAVDVKPGTPAYALKLAWSAYDALLYAVDVLVLTGKLERGSPKALKVKGYLDAIEKSLDLAGAALSAKTPEDALALVVQANTLTKLALDLAREEN